MKKILLLLGLTLPVLAQTSDKVAPDCGPVAINFNLSGQTTTPIDNRQSGCVTWTVAYGSQGFSGLTLTFQSAPGNVTPGSWITFPGTVDSGAAAMTSTTGEVSQFSNGTTQTQWLRVALSGTMGTGTISGVLYGYKTGSGGSGGGGGGGCADPCPVIGVTAQGVAPTDPPVAIGAVTDPAGLIHRILSDAAGRLEIVGPASPGAAPFNVSPNLQGNVGTDGFVHYNISDTNGRAEPAFVSAAGANGASNTAAQPAAAGAPIIYQTRASNFNGSTWDRNFYCPNQAAFTLSSATDVVIVTGVSSTISFICHVDFSVDTSQTLAIRQGTGSTCGTNTAVIAGTYGAMIAYAMDWQPTAPLHTTVAARDVCLHFGSAVTGGGVVMYATF